MASRRDDVPSDREAMFVFGWMEGRCPEEVDKARAAYKRSREGGS